MLTACKPGIRIKGDDGVTREFSLSGDTVTISGEDGDITITAGSSATWPKGKVGDLPEFAGKVESVWDGDNNIMITMEGVKMPEVEIYINTLKSNGWEQTSEFIINEDNVVGMWSFRKGDRSADLMFTSENGFCIITYGEYKDPEAWRDDYDWDDDQD